MNPHISIPRQHGATPTFGSTASTSRSDSLRMPRFFKRLFKFPQMDFEMAIWEMTHLLIAPKKVFRSIYYHVKTKNTYHLADPSFTYLLSAFQLLTGLAWGIASTPSVGATVRLTLIFIFVHCLLGSLVVATASFFLVGRLLGPGSSRGGRRRGLFGDTMAADRDRERGEEGEGLEFGYCFDVAIRAFFPAWIFLYVVQFMLWPLISRDYWISLFLGNTLYLIAAIYYTIIIFLGYNALPFLHHTELLLSPTFVYGVLWFASLFGFNVPAHVGPLFVLGARR